MSSKRIDQKSVRLIATKRMGSLCQFAEEQLQKDHPDRSLRYITMVRKLSTKNRTPIPNEYKKRICKHCGQYLIAGKNSRTRIHRGKVIVFCMNCSRYHRIPLKNK